MKNFKNQESNNIKPNTRYNKANYSEPLVEGITPSIEEIDRRNGNRIMITQKEFKEKYGGEQKITKESKIAVEVYSRVVGYFRPVNQWNKGKQEEFKNRKEYKINQEK